MRILVAVSDTDLRLSLELMLSEEPGVRIAGSVTDTSGLLALVKQTAPDLLLLDWELHGDSIESVLGELQALDCQPKCIVLGRRHSSQDPAERAGADVYITKGDPPERLLGAIRALNA
jgi:DNA-binding NarL/FixJ family response regulator